MRIALLGPTAISDDAGHPVSIGGAKQRAVLAQLAREPNRAVPVDRLAEGVWGEQVPERYRQNIQVYVSQWRRMLDPGRPAGTPSRIIGHRDAYELVAATAEVDVTQFLVQAEAGQALLEQGAPRKRPPLFAAPLISGGRSRWWICRTSHSPRNGSTSWNNGGWTSWNTGSTRTWPAGIRPA